MAETRAVMREISPKLADLTANVLFGDVWEQPDLSKRDRSLITVITHMAFYAGWPTAANAVRVAKEVFDSE
jgi:4-carboxymuconolactone decarboxylase